MKDHKLISVNISKVQLAIISVESQSKNFNIHPTSHVLFIACSQYARTSTGNILWHPSPWFTVWELYLSARKASWLQFHHLIVKPHGELARRPSRNAKRKSRYGKKKSLVAKKEGYGERTAMGPLA
jgi:hypothetical protein